MDWPTMIEWGEVRVDTNFAANQEPIGPHRMRPRCRHGVLLWVAIDRWYERDSGRVG